MEFASIPKSLEGFLDSLIPAMTQALIFIFIVFMFFGSIRFMEKLKSIASKNYNLQEIASNEFIKESGILKLVPIGVLIFALLFAIILDRAILFIGSSIPGSIVYSQPAALVKSVPSETLAKLWSLYPAANDEHDLYLVLEQQISEIPPPSNNSSNHPWMYHDNQGMHYQRVFLSMKFYLIFCLFILIFRKRLKIEPKKTRNRYAAVILFSIFAFTYSIYGLIESEKQSAWAKVNYIIVKKISSGELAENRLNDKRAQAELIKKINSYRDDLERKKEYAFHAGF